MKIGELAKRTGTETVTIRFYEKKGLMPPPQRSTANYRTYSDAHLERLLFIRHCRAIGLSLDEIGELLAFRDHPADSCLQVNRIIDAHIEQTRQQIDKLQQLVRQLRELRARCNDQVNPEGQAANCGILHRLEQCRPGNRCHGHPRACEQKDDS